MADLRGGVRGTRAAPLGVQILSISCSFLGKCGKIVCWLLDPGSATVDFVPFFRSCIQTISCVTWPGIWFAHRTSCSAIWISFRITMCTAGYVLISNTEFSTTRRGYVEPKVHSHLLFIMRELLCELYAK